MRMLQITIPGIELWDEKNEEFTVSNECTLTLEHSLISLSKWESKWCKPFLHSDKTPEETLDYIKCMTLNQKVDPTVYNRLTVDNITQINNYIEAPMTATTFSEDRTQKKNREIVTSELIYYWMASYQLPVEFEKWHLNRLITLIRVCGVKNQPPSNKKTSQRDLAAKYAAMNKQRRAKYNSKG
jgi:hypothetical protein